MRGSGKILQYTKRTPNYTYTWGKKRRWVCFNCHPSCLFFVSKFGQKLEKWFSCFNGQKRGCCMSSEAFLPNQFCSTDHLNWQLLPGKSCLAPLAEKDTSMNSVFPVTWSVYQCCCSEEDLYRDADEIEREKVLLEIGTDASGTFQSYFFMA